MKKLESSVMLPDPKLFFGLLMHCFKLLRKIIPECRPIYSSKEAVTLGFQNLKK